MLVKILGVISGAVLITWLVRPTRPDEPPVSADHHTAQDWPESPEERRERAAEEQLWRWERGA
jgi:hypothetical protein